MKLLHSSLLHSTFILYSALLYSTLLYSTVLGNRQHRSNLGQNGVEFNFHLLRFRRDSVLKILKRITESMNELINHKSFYRTATATPGLLINSDRLWILYCVGYGMVLCACFVLVCLDFFRYDGYDWVYLSRFNGDWFC